MKRSIPNSYMSLVRRLPLRPIRSQSEYSEALDLVRELMLRGESNLDTGQQDYLEALSRFVADYESEHMSVDVSGLHPIDVLKHLMEVRCMTTADLGRVLGSQSAASMLLSGRRQMSRSQIIKLAEHFAIEPGLLLRIASRSRTVLARAG